jgi:prepilin-type N-terminal cleavage/methylation domain-containing protein
MIILRVHPRRGFTLVEIIVVVSVIAVLSTVAYASFGEARKKARDTQRVSNISTLQTALRIMNDEIGSYPVYINGIIIGEGAVLDTTLSSYLSSTISDPSGSGADTTYEYVYDSSFDCAVAGTGRKVLYAKTMERTGAGNWTTVCGTNSGGTSANTYGVILQ